MTAKRHVPNSDGLASADAGAVRPPLVAVNAQAEDRGRLATTALAMSANRWTCPQQDWLIDFEYVPTRSDSRETIPSPQS
jgi:hypothetical protein